MAVVGGLCSKAEAPPRTCRWLSVLAGKIGSVRQNPPDRHSREDGSYDRVVSLFRLAFRALMPQPLCATICAFPSSFVPWQPSAASSWSSHHGLRPVRPLGLLLRARAIENQCFVVGVTAWAKAGLVFTGARHCGSPRQCLHTVGTEKPWSWRTWILPRLKRCALLCLSQRPQTPSALESRLC